MSDDEGMALLRKAREACTRWQSGSMPMSIPVRQSDADILGSAIDIYLAKPRQQSAEPVAYRERITGRLAAPEDEHRQRFPMCYEPLYVRCTANLHTQ